VYPFLSFIREGPAAGSAGTGGMGIADIFLSKITGKPDILA
jgi:hypothetical protein